MLVRAGPDKNGRFDIHLIMDFAREKATLGRFLRLAQHPVFVRTLCLSLSGYYHPFFLRGFPWEAHKICRISRKGSGPRKAASNINKPNFYNVAPYYDRVVSPRVARTATMEMTQWDYRTDRKVNQGLPTEQAIVSAESDLQSAQIDGGSRHESQFEAANLNTIHLASNCCEDVPGNPLPSAPATSTSQGVSQDESSTAVVGDDKSWILPFTFVPPTDVEGL